MLDASTAARPSALFRFAQRASEGLRRRGFSALLELAWLVLTGRARQGDALAGALGRLKGPFAKLGQWASIRVDALPPETRATLASLRDRVPPLPFWRIEELLEAELGRPVSDLFERIDPEPIGAASVAQVHRAVLPGGQEVAVKIQYPWLVDSYGHDIALLRFLLGRLAPGEGRDQLFEEFARSFQEELDFEREAQMAADIADNLAKDPQLVVPKVMASHSNARVLTMTWWPTLSLQDPAGLRAKGVPVAEVLRHIVRAYAQQIFVDGLFHADPHAGNLFVVDDAAARTTPKVLFVDFGLSQALDPLLRREVRRGIYALLQNDLDAFLDAMKRMDMIRPGSEAGVAQAVETMFDRLRGSGEGGALTLSGDRVLALKDEATDLLYATNGLTLPPQLLLYAKTLSYVFTLGRELAPEVDLMKLAVPYLLQFLASRDENQGTSQP